MRVDKCAFNSPKVRRVSK